MESRNSYTIPAKITLSEDLSNVTVEYYTECPNVMIDPFTLRMKSMVDDDKRSIVYGYKEYWAWDNDTQSYTLVGDKMRILSTTEGYALRKENMLKEFRHSDIKITDAEGNVTVKKIVAIPKRDKKWIVPRAQMKDKVNLGHGGTHVLPARLEWDTDFDEGDD